MKKRIMLLLMCCVFTLAGCGESQKEVGAITGTGAGIATESEDGTETGTETGMGVGAETEVSGVLPVISITSKANPDSLDFVTKPVDEFVSSSIASWTPGYKIPPAPYYEECEVQVSDADGTKLLSADAEVKVRGNWTTSYDKKPLRIKFSKKQNLLGMNDGAEFKNWVLLAGYKDASMLRDKATYQIAAELMAEDELYSSDARFVEVIINGEYWGVYLAVEQQEVKKNRIAVTEPEDDYEGTDIGYLLEYDGYYDQEDELEQFEMDYADNAELLPFNGDDKNGKKIRPLNEGGNDPKKNTGITIKSDIYSAEQRDFAASYLNNVYRIMYYAAYEDKAYAFNDDYTEIMETADMTPKQAVEAVVDVESLADAYILNELACDADVYWSSFFMSVDFGEDGEKLLRFEAPWDFDSAYGNKDRCADGKGFYAANSVWDVNNQYQAINPWLAVLMHEEWFQDIIRKQWTAAYDDGTFERAYTMIEEDTENYSAAFEKNVKRWNCIAGNTAKDEWCQGVKACKTQQEMSAYLENWLRTRVEFLNEYWHE